MFDEILVGFDDSSTSRGIFPYVAWLARSTGAHMVLISATPTAESILRKLTAEVESADFSGGFQFPSNEEVEAIETDLRSRAEAAAEKEAASLKSTGADVTSRVVGGSAAEALLAAAAAEPEAILALSTHGRSGVQRLFMGSVTTKVVRESKRAVLVLRPHGGVVPSSSDEIIVPLDGSERAETALPMAKDLAVRLHLPVHLIRSATLASFGYGFAEDGPAGYGDLAESTEHVARQYLEFIAKGLRFGGVHAVTESVVDKSPDEAIVEAVGSEGNKLVVMTTHGRSGLNRMVLGSVTDQVMRHSPGPVLMVPSIEG